MLFADRQAGSDAPVVYFDIDTPLLGEIFGAEPVGEELRVGAGAVDALDPQVGAALFHEELTASAAGGEDVSRAVDGDNGHEFSAAGEV